MEELDKIFGGEKETPEVPSQPEPKPVDEEFQKKQEQLENLNRAIKEANENLKKIREAKKKPKEDEEEEIPKIDFDDPSSKAWAKHIQGTVDPLQAELEKEKEEIRNFALREFLEDKPSVSKDPAKLKELMETYQKIKTASERTKEGVLNDLNKAFAATFHEELIRQARDNRVRKVQGDILFSDPLVSRGSTAYFQEHEVSPAQSLSDEDKMILAKWGMTPEEWAQEKTERDKREKER